MINENKKAIFLFFSTLLIVSFYDSKKIVIWETQRQKEKNEIFQSLVLSLATESEEIKEKFGLKNFFEKEYSFWLKLKKSPIIFQEQTIQRRTGEEAEIKKEELEKTEIAGTKERQKEESAKKEEKINEENKKEKVIKGEEGIIKKEENVKRKEEVVAEEEEKQPEIIREETKGQIEKNQFLTSPYKILIIGDSFIAVYGGVGDPLVKELLSYKDVEIFRLGRVSSGLSRPDYFNWELTTKELISRYKPNAVIVMLGLNDAQALTAPAGKVLVNYLNFGKEAWNIEYGKRASNLLNIFEENNIITFWIGLPIMRDKDFSNKMEKLNYIYENEIQEHKNAYFISTRELLRDVNGNYTAYLPDNRGIPRLVRISDGIHLTFFGGNIVVEKVIKKMSETMKLESK